MATPVLSGSNETKLKELFQLYLSDEQNAPKDKDAMTEQLAKTDAYAAWAREKLRGWVGHFWPKPAKRTVDERQQFFEGFDSLEVKLPTKDGDKALREMRLGMLKKSREIVWSQHVEKWQQHAEKKPSKLLRAIDAAIERFTPYGEAEPNMRYGEFVDTAFQGFKPLRRKPRPKKRTR